MALETPSFEESRISFRVRSSHKPYRINYDRLGKGLNDLHSRKQALRASLRTLNSRLFRPLTEA